MHLIIAVVALLTLSALAFWKPVVAPLFMIMAAMSMMIGLYWYDMYTNELGMSMSLAFIIYSFVCFGLAFKVIFSDGGD